MIDGGGRDWYFAPQPGVGDRDHRRSASFQPVSDREEA
jgi:hypothetical protein